MRVAELDTYHIVPFLEQGAVDNPRADHLQLAWVIQGTAQGKADLLPSSLLCTSSAPAQSNGT